MIDRSEPQLNPGERIRVLLVEDDPDFARTTGYRLSRQKTLPMEIECVHDLQSGIEALRTRPFDLILLDLSLPDSRDMETYDKMHSAAPWIPIVILTGWGNDMLAVEAVRRGAEDYLVKGEFEGKIIPRVAHYAIERHRIKQELESLTRKLRETNSSLERLTLLDSLTGLLNRRGLQQVLSQEIKRASRSGNPLMAMMIDVDDFKTINDSFGYAAGDIVLREVAGLIQKSLRLTDHASRVGGDEFLALLPGISQERGVGIAERLRETIALHPFVLEFGRTLNVSVSIGVLAAPDHAPSADLLLALTHPLLRESKKRGKNRICVEQFAETNAREAAEALEREFALVRDEANFYVLRQPVRRLATKEIIGFEFLGRLNSKMAALPDEFFRLATENNILQLADLNCLKKALKQTAGMEKDIRFHFNLFPSTLMELPARELLSLFRAAADPKRCCIEVSERRLTGSPAYLTGELAPFREAGISVAVDDVGYGSSSLEHLLSIEPEMIKLDPKLIRHISRETGRMKILKYIIAFARDIKAEIIAEGIEAEDDLNALIQTGVLYGQGYLLDRPEKTR